MNEDMLQEINLAAVRCNGYNIEYIKNPSDQVKLVAVQENGNAIEFIIDKNKDKQLKQVIIDIFTSCLKYLRRV